MSDTKVKIEEIEELISEFDLDKAEKLLDEISEQKYLEGQVEYERGLIEYNRRNINNALNYFQTAIDKGFNNCYVHMNMGKIKEETKQFNEAERSYEKAIKYADDPVDRWSMVGAYVSYYIKRKMYLKAEKMTGALIREYPNNYLGYHLQFMIHIERKSFEETISYLKIVPDELKIHPQHLIDVIGIYEHYGKTKQLLDILNTDENYINVIPEYALSKKIELLSELNEYDKVEEVIDLLALNYGNRDAILSKMIILFKDGKYKESGILSGDMMNKEKDTLGYRFYLAVFFHMFNMYYLAEGKLSVDARKWIIKAGEWCLEYANSILPDITELVNVIEDLFVKIGVIEGES